MLGKLVKHDFIATWKLPAALDVLVIALGIMTGLLIQLIPHVEGSMGIGISSIVLMQNMPAVVLALILGTILGVVTHLGERIERGGARLAKLVPGGSGDNALTEGNITFSSGDVPEQVRIASGFVEVCENHVIACVEPCA